MLLSHGDDTRALSGVNHWLQTPMAAASLKGHTEVKELLEAQGAKMASSMHTSFYPLHMAAQTGDVGEHPPRSGDAGEVAGLWDVA